MVSDVQYVEQCYCAECLVNKERNKEAGRLMYAKDWVCMHVSISSKLLVLEIQGAVVNSYRGALPYTIFARSQVM